MQPSDKLNVHPKKSAEWRACHAGKERRAGAEGLGAGFGGVGPGFWCGSRMGGGRGECAWCGAAVLGACDGRKVARLVDIDESLERNGGL